MGVLLVERLKQEIEKCRICASTQNGAIGSVLPHEPNPVVVLSKTAKIAICGQAPGTRVHKSGKPFTDPSGDRLREWLGVSEAQFYDADLFSIIPMGFCFPGLDEKGSDKPPRKECALTWLKRVFESMPQIELYLTIGGYAQKYHLGKNAKKSVSETVASWREYVDMPIEGKRYLPLPHPSWRNTGWIKKNAYFERDLLPFLKCRVKELLV